MSLLNIFKKEKQIDIEIIEQLYNHAYNYYAVQEYDNCKLTLGLLFNSIRTNTKIIEEIKKPYTFSYCLFLMLQMEIFEDENNNIFVSILSLYMMNKFILNNPENINGYKMRIYILEKANNRLKDIFKYIIFENKSNVEIRNTDPEFQVIKIIYNDFYCHPEFQKDIEINHIYKQILPLINQYSKLFEISNNDIINDVISFLDLFNNYTKKNFIINK